VYLEELLELFLMHGQLLSKPRGGILNAVLVGTLS
jgi:hypothetical protein